MTENKQTDKEIANNKAEQIMNGVAIWASFYRANPHRFCKDYLNINLKLFQKILIHMMNLSNYFMYIAARGAGKTFLIAIYCAVRCILYPETKIAISSGKRGQAREVLEKITDILLPNSENLKIEIKKTVVNQSEAFIEFHNGSKIKVITANDNARSGRANILIVDEFRMVDKNIIETVLRKFLTSPRQPKYLKKKEYSHLLERNKELYLSSAWFKSHWSFQKAQAYTANLIDDKKKYFICGLPYQLSIREGLLMAEQVADEMSEADFSEFAFNMEMGCLWFDDADGTFFTYEDVSKSRILKHAYYPDYISRRLNDKKIKIPELADAERRILSLDVALLASKKQNNDAASIFINSAIPSNGGKFIANFIYTENHEGLHTQDLALIARRLFHIFKCTDLVIDVKGVGAGVADTLLREIYDPEFNITYSPLNCCNDKVWADRCFDKDAPKSMWVVNATTQFNSDMYLSLRDGFKEGKINLLCSEFDCDEFLKEYRGFKTLDEKYKLQLRLPYIHTGLLIQELINLEHETSGTLVRVYEKSGMRKDRVSSIGYNYYVQREIERTGRKRKKDDNEIVNLIFKAPSLRKI